MKIYHGTDTEVSLPLSVEEAISYGGRTTAGTGIYFTSSIEMAREYGENIITAELSPTARVFDFAAPLDIETVKQVTFPWWGMYDDETGAEAVVDAAISRSLTAEGSELGAPGTIGRAIQEIRVALAEEDLLDIDRAGEDLSDQIHSMGYDAIHYVTAFPEGHPELRGHENYECWNVLREDVIIFI